MLAVSQNQSDASRNITGSETGRREQEEKLSSELQRAGEAQPQDVTPVTEQLNTASLSNEDLARDDTAPSTAAERDEAGIQKDDNRDAEAGNANRDSTPSTYSTQDKPTEEEKVGSPRLSITIPGHPE